MSDRTRVYLITGFLGAGKTTFLNRIIDRFPKDKKMTLLVNEFGEVGVDGTLVEGEDIDMMEISKGSIFCVCVKTDFIKGLYELNTKVKPDVLMIESTGVANPSDLKKDLKLPIFDNRFEFKEQFCVIDAAHFLDAYQVYASLEKQIASSTAFIINKVDLAGAETVQAIKDVVRQFHPDPQFFETTYAEIPLERFFELHLEPPLESAGSPLRQMTEEELDRFLEDLLDSPDLEITPPDTLVSTAYRWHGNDLEQVRLLARTLPPEVLRAKGFVDAGDGMHIFNYVMGTWTVEPTDIPPEKIQHKNVVIFIAPPESMDGIAEVTQSGDWTGQGVYQPYRAG
jgi:G3E family GTPase